MPAEPIARACCTALRSSRPLRSCWPITQLIPAALAAVQAGTFVAPSSMTRMTWIKPSFLWKMYRCGWATNSGQERVLAVRMSRAGFENALRQSCLSHYDPNRHTDEASWRRDLKTSPVRIQWDPERTPEGHPLPLRSLQVGPQVVPS